MIKVKEFMTKENYEIDDQINDFIEDEHNGVNKCYDVKFTTFLDTTHNIIMSSALLVYDEIPYEPKNKMSQKEILKKLESLKNNNEVDRLMGTIKKINEDLYKLGVDKNE